MQQGFEGGGRLILLDQSEPMPTPALLAIAALRYGVRLTIPVLAGLAARSLTR